MSDPRPSPCLSVGNLGLNPWDCRKAGLKRSRVGILHSESALAADVRDRLQSSGEFMVMLLPPTLRNVQPLRNLNLQLLVAELLPANLSMARQLQVATLFGLPQSGSWELVVDWLDLKLAGMADLSDSAELLSACRTLRSGQSYLAPKLGHPMLRWVVGRGRHLRLTAREYEILQAMKQGQSLAEIARRLTMSVNTVKNHASSIYLKLNVRSRRQAVAQANLGIENSLISEAQVLG